MKKGIIITFILLISASIFGQTATTVEVLDKRDNNEPPTYYNRQVSFEFKKRDVIGVPGSGYYSGLMTIAPWRDNTGNAHHQLNFNDGGIFYRTGLPSSEIWGSWTQILTSNMNIKLEGTYGAEFKKGVYPFKAFWNYSDDGTGYGPAWIHTNTSTNGTTNPTMFLQTSGNSAHLRVNDAIGLGPMTVSLGSYPSITTNTWISGAQGENSFINNGGNLLIGKKTQQNANYKLDVEGTIRANEIKVNLDGADFVFEPDYKLRRLSVLEKYIKEHQHLPEIVPASEMKSTGVNVGEMNTLLLQKIEELTLYIIEQNKEIEKLKKRLDLNEIK